MLCVFAGGSSETIEKENLVVVVILFPPRVEHIGSLLLVYGFLHISGQYRQYFLFEQHSEGDKTADTMNQEQLRELENTAEVFFNGTNPQQKASAQERLLVLGSSVQYIPQCQYILDNSSSQLAILVAVNSLMRLVTEHWNSFSSSQRVEMRKYQIHTLLIDSK